MSFRSILASLRSVPSLPRVRAAGRRPGFRPGLEPLEDRSVPATFTVLNLADAGNGSLRQAVLDANALPGADTIRFADGLVGTIGLTGGQLSIADHLIIDGPGADRLAVSGNGQSRVFRISGGLTVAIDDLTITGGRAVGDGGGILNTGGTLTLDRVVLSNNQAVGVGLPAGAAAGPSPIARGPPSMSTTASLPGTGRSAATPATASASAGPSRMLLAAPSPSAAVRSSATRPGAATEAGAVLAAESITAWPRAPRFARARSSEARLSVAMAESWMALNPFNSSEVAWAVPSGTVAGAPSPSRIRP